MVLAAWIVLATSDAAGAAERILRFHADLTVEVDGTLRVREDIRVLASGNKIRRGIFRDIPTRYRDHSGVERQASLVVEGVLRDGAPEPYRVVALGDGGKRIYIGHPDRLVAHGERAYAIQYRTRGHVGHLEGHDQLHWNVTGNGWDFPIDSATAVVLLPEAARPLLIAAKAATGTAGSRDARARVERIGGLPSFATTERLRTGHGLTVLVTWPKGIVHRPGVLARIGDALVMDPVGTGCLLALVIVLAYYLVVWHRVGRDPKSETLFVATEPPRISPGAARFLTTRGWDDRVFPAALLGLAARGAVTLDLRDGKYVARRATGGQPMLMPEEDMLLTALLGDRTELTLSSENHEVISRARENLRANLESSIGGVHFAGNRRFLVPGALISAGMLGWLIATPARAWEDGTGPLLVLLGIWTGLVALFVKGVYRAWHTVVTKGQDLPGAVVITLLVIPALWLDLYGLAFFGRHVSTLGGWAFVSTLAAHALFAWLLRNTSAAGRALLDRLRAYDLYLSARDRWHPVAQTAADPIQTFARHLPYAFALGRCEPWARRFETTVADASTAAAAVWYSGLAVDDDRPHRFADRFDVSFTSSVAGACSAPATAGGGSGSSSSSGSDWTSDSSSSSGSSSTSSGGGGGGGGGGGW